MKLNLYKCSTTDLEWYSLAKGICNGAIPLYCGQSFFGGSVDVPPEKIEFFKEVEIDISQYIDEEIKKIKEENQILQSELDIKTSELKSFKSSDGGCISDDSDKILTFLFQNAPRLPSIYALTSPANSLGGSKSRIPPL